MESLHRVNDTIPPLSLCSSLWSLFSSEKKIVEILSRIFRGLEQETLHPGKTRKKTKEEIVDALVRPVPVAFSPKNSLLQEPTLEAMKEVCLSILSNPPSDTKGYAIKQWKNGSFEGVLIEAQGTRPAMEDRSMWGTIRWKEQIDIPYFLLCDGHGGSEAAEFCIAHFSNLFSHRFNQITDLNDHEHIWCVCKEIPVTLSLCYQYSPQRKKNNGTCLLLVFFLPGNMYTVNVGDSRGILIKNPDVRSAKMDQGIQITYDQTLIDKKISKSFFNRKGETYVDKVGNTRTGGGLLIPRTLGAFHGYKGHTSLPTLRCFSDRLLLDDQLFVLACDGLWDALSTPTVARFCRIIWNEQRGKRKEKAILRALATTLHLFALPSRDNLSLFIGRKKHSSEESSGSETEIYIDESGSDTEEYDY